MLVRALYAFTATSGNELSIHAAERLALIEGGYNSESGSCWGDSGWVRVATLDGRREGFVPASYVLLDDGDDGDDDGDDGDDDSEGGVAEQPPTPFSEPRGSSTPFSEHAATDRELLAGWPGRLSKRACLKAV